MITAQFVCVQCNLFVEDNKTLELHVKEHREFECTDCKIKFEKYKDLVSHRLTFCRSPLNSKTCLECNINKDSCQCQNNLQQTIKICKEWTTTKCSEKMLDNDSLSGLLEFISTQKQNKIKLLEDTNVTELLPKVEIAQNKIILNGRAFEWKQITTNLSNYYNNYLKIEAEFNKIYAIFIKNCFICEKIYNEYHLLQEHPIQLEARDIHSGVLPVRYTDVALFVKKMYNMLEFGNFQCVLCDQEITNAQGINEIFIHYNKNHKDYELAREQCIDNVTDVCQKSLLSSETILKHLLVIHCVKLEYLFEQLPIKLLDRTTIQESAATNSAAETTAVIRDSNNKQLYHNGNNLSNTHNIKNAIEYGDFRLN